MIGVFLRLIQLVKPLIHVMACTITCGVLGYLCSIFVTILGGYAILSVMNLIDVSIKKIFFGIGFCAVMRAVLRYCEQSTGHYIAFKLLAIIRDKVFRALRKLCPAKLEVKDKGNLISIITSDIELLEVFYAHTIAPVCIALITSLIMVIYIASYNKKLALIAAIAYFTVGVIIPWIASTFGRKVGSEFRNMFGDMNSYILDNLRGLRETIQFRNGTERLERMNEKIDALSERENNLKTQAGFFRGITDVAILAFSFSMVIVGVQSTDYNLANVLIPTLALMSSFGPVAALSSLSADLNHTAAAGERVLAIIDENPQVSEVIDGEKATKADIEVKDLTFKYNEEVILKDIDLSIAEHSMIGIVGRSGSGKSTLLKLLMRFWDTSKGEINISDVPIKKLQTSSLRNLESYVTQETAVFHDSIENNIKIAKLDATHEEVVAAAKKASLHEFVEGLPQKYETNVGELGDRLSGGEIQRIGLARAFLHDSPLIILDEPTSNLDSLNEAIILKSILDERKDKTVILVSHRASTIKSVDRVFSVESGRLS